MKRFVVIFPLVCLAVLLFGLSDISANDDRWYTGYNQISTYGIWADIGTPGYIPFGQAEFNWTGYSNWVSTIGPHWVQGGWRWYPHDSYFIYPEKYHEYRLPGWEIDPSKYLLTPVGWQYWGTTEKYEVSHDSSLGPDVWCVWIGGFRQTCQSLSTLPAPNSLLAYTEVHFSGFTDIYTEFSNIRKMTTSGGTWQYPSLSGNFTEQYPYKVTQITNDHFVIYRIDSRVLLPYIILNWQN